MLWGPVRGAPAAGPWALGLCTRAPTREAASPASAAPPSARGWRAWVGGLPLPVPVLTSQLGNPSKSAHLWPRSSSARGRGPGARGGVESGHVNQPADAPVLGWRSKTGRSRGGGGGAGSWRPDTGLRSKPTPPPPPPRLRRVSVRTLDSRGRRVWKEGRSGPQGSRPRPSWARIDQGLLR